MREVLHAKIHNATVTEANPAYIGSITIDGTLVDAAGFWEGQKVLVVSNTSGERLETYVIRGKPNSGIICMNGACAHRISIGEVIIIMGFTLADAPIVATVLLVNAQNEITRTL